MVYKVEYKEVDLGIGDFPPKWVCFVSASSEAMIRKIAAFHGFVILKVSEAKIMSMKEFNVFLQEKRDA